MADWLRPVFGRGRTQGVSNISDRASNISFDESVAGMESEDGNSVHASTPRLRPTSRVSSYIGIRPSTPPVLPTPDTFFSFRDPESVYHAPSGDQLVEMLKVVMMNQSSVASVPIEYNSTILHVLEAYQELQSEVRRKEESMEELKRTHTKDIKDFETLATQWELKERDYKREIRQMEILLGKTEGGLAKVTLARSKSTVHGSNIGEKIGRDVGTIKARHFARTSKGRSDDTTDGLSDLTPDDKYRADRFFKTRIRANAQGMVTNVGNKRPEFPSKDRVLQPRASTGSFPIHTSPEELNEPVPPQGPNLDLALLSKTQLADLERQRAHAEFGVAFDSSSESESSTNSPDRKTETSLPVMAPSGLGIGFQAKHTPVYPKGPVRQMREPTGSGGRYASLAQEAPSQVAFSFRPGDDEVLAQRARTGQTPRRIPERRSYHQRSTEAGEPHGESASVARDSVAETVVRPSKPEPAVPAGRPATLSRTSSRSRPREIQEAELVKRDDSNSSFVTALRDNSGRSSASGAQDHGQRRRRLDRNSGSSEAVAAAARALAAAKKRPALDQSSSSGDRGARARSSQDSVSVGSRGRSEQGEPGN